MRHPSMTTRGTRITVAVALAIVIALPKRVECGRIVPLGVYVIELVVQRDVGLSYEPGRDCR